MSFMSEPVISIKGLNKTYKDGFNALKDISLDIQKGEIFGLLGPNGAGKTTMISIVAGLTRRSSGEVTVFGKDVEKDYRFTRSKIGLVPQEIAFDPFFKVKEMVALQAGYFGMRNVQDHVKDILEKLSLWDKRDSMGRQLSGGMKRRVMIAKAMVHDPEILFLDEPTAGVDIELRQSLWQLVRNLQEMGKTIVLTTHYLEEAEDMADRIGIINDGRLVKVEGKKELMSQHGHENLEQVYTEIIKADRENGKK